MLGGGVDATTLVAALSAGPHSHHSFSCSQTIDIQRDTSTHAEGTDLGGGTSRASKDQEARGPLCSKLVAAVSGIICIAVVSASSGVIVLSEQAVIHTTAASSSSVSRRSFTPQLQLFTPEGSCASLRS